MSILEITVVPDQIYEASRHDASETLTQTISENLVENMSETQRLEGIITDSRRHINELEKRAEDRDAIAEQLNRLVSIAIKMVDRSRQCPICREHSHTADLLELLMSSPKDLLAKRDDRVRQALLDEMN